MNFVKGQKVVIPAHGLAVISAVAKRVIGRSTKDFYVFRVVDTNLIMMHPVDNTTARPLSDKTTVDKALAILDTDIKVENTTWNRRYRQYLDDIQTADIIKIATVVRSLQLLEKSKDLSFGERKMFDNAKKLLYNEVDAVNSQ